MSSGSVPCGEEVLNLLVAALREAVVRSSDGEEGERLPRAHDTVRDLREFLHRGGRRHGHGKDDGGSTRRPNGGDRGTRRVPGGGAVVAHDHEATLRLLGALAQEEALLAAELGEFTIAHPVEGCRGEARGEEAPDERQVKVGAAATVARRDRAKRNLFVPRNPEFAGGNRVEGETEFVGDRRSDGDSATGQPEDEAPAHGRHLGANRGSEDAPRLGPVRIAPEAEVVAVAVLLR